MSAHRCTTKCADPAELLVRHEMWLQGGPDTAATVGGNATRVLVHYLGDDAFHQMSIPPRPIKIVDGGSSKGNAGGGAAATSKEGEESLYSDETGSHDPGRPVHARERRRDVETSLERDLAETSPLCRLAALRLVASSRRTYY